MSLLQDSAPQWFDRVGESASLSAFYYGWLKHYPW
jgi:hypothetical protein